MTSYWDDDERKTRTLTKVEGPRDGWFSVTADHIGFGIEAKYGVVPKVGDRATIWGSLGRPIRGIALNDQVLYYRTPTEQRVEDAKQNERWRAEKMAEYEAKAADYDRRVAALPESLRLRIEGFRAHGGHNWRWNYEPYEMASCEEAARLARHFTTDADLRRFSQLGYDAQKAAYPEMDSGHSGNTWGHALRLAHWLLTKPELVPQEHAAICPLVGCEDAGCHSARSAESRPPHGREPE